jgi:ATP-dependent exoDNAse (exonuclease V) alpha subunit
MDKTIREHDGVVLLRDLPEENLVAGETGVVVYVHKNADAFEVEFPNPSGSPRYIVETIQASDLMKLLNLGVRRAHAG